MGFEIDAGVFRCWCKNQLCIGLFLAWRNLFLKCLGSVEIIYVVVVFRNVRYVGF